MTEASDSPTPDGHGAARPGSGPAEVSVSIVVAARKGDPAAFAQMVEHWDRHLRAFVHHTLGGEGATDRVLAAAYLRAYRALPRYSGELKPGLWLHRIAYLAALDDLRRTSRDPLRRPGARTDDASAGTGEAPAPEPEPAAVLARLAPDQRALAVMVDLEHYRLTTVAVAFDTPPAVAGARLGAARRALVGGAEVEAAGPEALVPARPKVAVLPEEAASPDDLPGEADLVPPPVGAPAGWVPTAGPPTDTESVRVLTTEPPEPADRPATPAEAEADVEPEPAADPPPEAEPASEPQPEAGPESDVEAEGAVGATDGGGADDDSSTGPGSDPSPNPAPVPAADRSDELGYQVHLLLADLPVPPASPTFWADLGRRLLAEREQPAAPTPDPVARLARHPAEPGFRPDDAISDTVSVMADQAERSRPRRSWGRPLALLAAVALLATVVAVAVRFGTSDPPPDGSVPAGELAATLTAALGANDVASVAASVETPGGEVQPFSLTLDRSGSWSASRTDRIDLTAYDTATGIVRTVSAEPGEDGGDPVVQATIAAGLAAGAPDPSADAPSAITDLQRAAVLLRADPDRRAAATSVGDTRTWTLGRDLEASDASPAERWEVEVRRSDGLPVRIEVRRGDELVRRTTYSRWTPAAEVGAGTFDPPVPDGVQPLVTTAGFVTTDLASVGVLGRGEAITPAWLPTGFELSTVAIRATAPDAGTPSTAGGANPPDEAVVSLGFQRGAERITVSTRASGGRSDSWRNPFDATADTGAGAGGDVDTRTLGDGRFNGLEVEVRTDPLGRAHLWGVSTETVLTVSGDLTPAEAIRVASSLRG